MRRQYIVQFRLFCRWSWSLLTGFHFPYVQTVYGICGIFLDDISTREVKSLLSWFIATEAIFLCFTGVLCGLTNSPHFVKYPLNWGWCAWSAGSLKQWLPNGKLLLLSVAKCHDVPCLLPSIITTKVLKNCNTFSSRPRPNVQDQDFMIQDQDFHLCPRDPRPWSRGLHHWEKVYENMFR